MPTRAQLGTALFAAVYFALAFACLRQSGPQPWAGLDVFAGGFLGLMILATVYELIRGFPTLRSMAVLREATGGTYDAGTLVAVPFLAAGDLLIFLDYGHWHLDPGLRHPVLQSAGLALSIAASAWLAWTDADLTRHFARASPGQRILQDGPFRYVRHPRYAGVLATRLAFALTFASAIGWVLAIAWTIVVLRRIRLEERHLRELFGREYDAYAAHTPRLIPGVY